MTRASAVSACVWFTPASVMCGHSRVNLEKSHHHPDEMGAFWVFGQNKTSCRLLGGYLTVLGQPSQGSAEEGRQVQGVDLGQPS